jgi:hypothetical protein
MDNEKIFIGRTKPESFLICDDSLKDIDAPFYAWLREEGFTFAGRKGHYSSCDWAYVSITHRIFGYGMPRVAAGAATGGHAITIEEFKVIYQIYRNYEGQGIFACRKDHGPHRIYVNPSDREKRTEFIDHLESKGFKCREDEVTNRQSTIDSPYPVIVDITRKIYGHLHNTTSAAAASSKGKVISVEEFYALYKGPDAEWEEYVAAVREILKKYLAEEEVDQYLAQPDTVKLIEDNYDGYTKRTGTGADPEATAYCLWMLY